MTAPLPSPLPRLDRALLRAGRHIVPVGERTDWLRCWHAELWHRRHPRAGAAHLASDLYPGLIRDALWLRTDSWSRAFAGTALLCLAALIALTVAAALPLLAFFGDLRLACIFLLSQLPRLLVEATLTTFVGFAIAARPVEHTSAHATIHAPRRLVRAHLFHAAKLILLQLLACLVSLDLTQPIHPAHPFTAEVLQPQLFTLLALIALRWSFQDQDSRCRHCLRSLAAPARVGRPSWNFLDTNGTHLSCPDGHGLLSIPEIETSWRQSSEWIAQ